MVRLVLHRKNWNNLKYEMQGIYEASERLNWLTYMRLRFSLKQQSATCHCYNLQTWVTRFKVYHNCNLATIIPINHIWFLKKKKFVCSVCSIEQHTHTHHKITKRNRYKKDSNTCGSLESGDITQHSTGVSHSVALFLIQNLEGFIHERLILFPYSVC